MQSSGRRAQPRRQRRERMLVRVAVVVSRRRRMRTRTSSGSALRRSSPEDIFARWAAPSPSPPPSSIENGDGTGYFNIQFTSHSKYNPPQTNCFDLEDFTFFS
jgi:hypothetical protein